MPTMHIQQRQSSLDNARATLDLVRQALVEATKCEFTKPTGTGAWMLLARQYQDLADAYIRVDEAQRRLDEDKMPDLTVPAHWVDADSDAITESFTAQ